ncbi:hypothetical protein K439DRAFT_796311 [Ramaria rubella]|nr:hypothetical protein K439DRAFT_796311 [Ramaria rubella]
MTHLYPHVPPARDTPTPTLDSLVQPGRTSIKDDISTGSQRPHHSISSDNNNTANQLCAKCINELENPLLPPRALSIVRTRPPLPLLAHHILLKAECSTLNPTPFPISSQTGTADPGFLCFHAQLNESYVERVEQVLEWFKEIQVESEREWEDMWVYVDRMWGELEGARGELEKERGENLKEGEKEALEKERREKEELEEELEKERRGKQEMKEALEKERGWREEMDETFGRERKKLWGCLKEILGLVQKMKEDQKIENGEKRAMNEALEKERREKMEMQQAYEKERRDQEEMKQTLEQELGHRKEIQETLEMERSVHEEMEEALKKTRGELEEARRELGMRRASGKLSTKALLEANLRATLVAVDSTVVNMEKTLEELKGGQGVDLRAGTKMLEELKNTLAEVKETLEGSKYMQRRSSESGKVEVQRWFIFLIILCCINVSVGTGFPVNYPWY